MLEVLELASVSHDPALRRELLTFVFCGGGFSGIEGAAAIEDLVHEALRYYPAIGPTSRTSSWRRTATACWPRSTSGSATTC